MSEGGRKPKGLHRISKLSKGHQCLREESKKTKGSTQDNQTQQRSQMPEGGRKPKGLHRISKLSKEFISS